MSCPGAASVVVQPAQLAHMSCGIAVLPPQAVKNSYKTNRSKRRWWVLTSLGTAMGLGIEFPSLPYDGQARVFSRMNTALS